MKEAYLIDENGIVLDTTHIKKGQKVKIIAKAEENQEINKISMNSLPIEFQKQADGSVVSKEFLTINEQSTYFQIDATPISGIEWTEVKEPRISSENGMLSIDTQDTPLQSVQIYDLKGQLIAQKSKPEWVENFHLSQGLYFVNWRTVKGELKTVKIMVT